MPGTDADVQQLTRAERLSLMIAKAHDYTMQYEQVILTFVRQGGQSCMQVQSAMFPSDLLCMECFHLPYCNGDMQHRLQLDAQACRQQQLAWKAAVNQTAALSCCVTLQIVAAGLLQQTGLLACSDWQANFQAAVSAAYLSVQPSMHTIIVETLMDSLPCNPPNSTKVMPTDESAESTADDAVLLAHSQPKSDQVPPAEAVSARQKHNTLIGSVLHPSRVVKTAWAETPKPNSVSPLPLAATTNGNTPNGTSLVPKGNQVQGSGAHQKSLAEISTAFARCVSLL